MKKRSARTTHRGPHDPERETIRAGLHARPCPAGGNPFLHLAAEYCCIGPNRSPAWPRIVAVFRSLDRAERVAIIRARREDRDAVGKAERRRAFLRATGSR